MQPAQEDLFSKRVKELYEYQISGTSGIFAFFVHANKSTTSLDKYVYKNKGYSVTPGSLTLVEFIHLNKKSNYRPIPCMRNIADVKNWIGLNPGIQGALIENVSGYISKFRFVKPRVSCDTLFWKRFDRSKLRGRAADFKDFLWDEIYDCYIMHDNHNMDPLHGRREQILSHLSPLFRVVDLNDGEGWKPVHIDKLSDPTMGRPLAKDTLGRYIRALKRK